jgi:hypothetical protein
MISSHVHFCTLVMVSNTSWEESIGWPLVFTFV